MMKSRLCLILFSLVFTVSYAGTWDTITAEKLQSIIASKGSFFTINSSYNVKYTMASYRGHKSQTPFEETTGYIRRKGDLFNIEILDVTSIQDKKVRVSIDKQRKMVTIQQPDKSLIENISNTNIDSKKQVYLLQKFDGHSIVKVIAKVGPISSVELKIKDGFIEQITSFYKTAHEWTDEKGTSKKSKPKLVISYSVLQKQPPLKKVQEVISYSSGKYQLTPKYNSFELLDLRVQKSK